MDWNDLKKHIYREDGSLRDIYIRNITPVDWKRWVEFININYKVKFEIGSSYRADKIDFDVVVNYWNDSDHECPSAGIHLGHTIIKTYFFQETEFENDITPDEIRNLFDHQTLIEYLKNISKLFGNPVELTEENYQEPHEVLMIVKGDKIVYP